MSHKTLFLQQSYIDCTNQYTALLEAPKLPLWDYVILTASNEEQAASYRTQIQYRLDHNMLPASTHYAVLPDPDGKRVGSGGATLNVLRYVHENAGSFENQRILVIHSGGDSKRVPQYSACGKLFSPVPRVLPNGKRSTLFDEFMISMSGVAARMNAGMLVCSGDVLLLFNPLQIDFYGKGAAALSIKEPAEIGKNHGVYRVDGEGNVGGFLHKKTVEQLQSLGASDDQGNVDIDTGAVIFDSEMLQALYQLVDTKEKFAAYVNERTRLSFYADFLYPLASDSTLEQYYKETPEGDFTPELEQCRTELWSVLHPYQMKLIRMSPAAFIHFGTTKELRELMTERMEEFCYLGWSSHIHTNRAEQNFAVSNSYVSPAAEIGVGSYLEDSMIRHKSQIGEECVISGVTLDGQAIPDHTVLHGLKLLNGKFVVRMYGVSDNPKEASLFGKELPVPLWEAPIYPVCASMEEAVHQTLEAWKEGFPIWEDGISLKDSFNQADLSALLPWQEKVSDKVELEEILEAIDRKENLTRLVEEMRDGISERIKAELLKEAQRLSETELEQFSRKIRIYYVLSCFEEKYMDSCFATISSGILAGAVKGLSYDADAKMGKDQVTVNLPVRVNWGGGWSDTPPYCNEKGGTVLNAAILLGGEYPVEVHVRRLPKPMVVLESADMGARGEFTAISDLQECHNPYDPFVLHKAALIACGVIPREGGELTDITAKIGGLYVSTQMHGVPKGSGLGTSSILAGACVKALFQYFGVAHTEDDLYEHAMCVEQIMSTGGGWQDQVGGMTPGLKLITAPAGIQQKLNVRHIALSEDTKAELNARFTLIYTGQRRLARNLLRDVVGRYISNAPDSLYALEEIQRIAVMMAFELERGHVDDFAKLLNRHWELSKTIDAGSTNTCIDQIFLAIDDLIDGRMICGAGGGGFLQVLLKRGVTREQLNARLHDTFQDCGVDVWDCTLV